MPTDREDGLEPGTIYTPEEFPLYYEAHAQFKLNGNPSGATSAQAVLTFELNNYPHIVYGVRLVNTTEIPQTALNANPSLPLNLLEGGIDEDQVIAIDLAQQNIITRPIHQRTLVGQAGRNWHPFPAPYLLRGGNNVKLTATRLHGYPQVTVGEELVNLLPSLFGTLVTGVLVSDKFPASGPPSTDADDRRRRG
jgi:hypothetical protein